MKFGYVCTNFNNSEFTVEAVRTLARNQEHEHQVVVVDNCSDPENIQILETLEKESPQVKVIFNRENEGYFRGLNRGIEYLRRHHPDIGWMVVGNNDLEFPKDFADKLDANAERWALHAVVSPDVITVDRVHQNPHVISGISRTREIFYDLYYSNYYVGALLYKVATAFGSHVRRGDEDHWKVARPIYQGHGSCYLLGPRFFEQFSELWAPTFLMSEEYFLSKQLSDVGQQVYYDPSIQVVHHWHASLAKLPSKRRWQYARDAHQEYRKYVKVFG
jgi:GT2 family glycosyltransferase